MNVFSLEYWFAYALVDRALISVVALVLTFLIGLVFKPFAGRAIPLWVQAQEYLFTGIGERLDRRKRGKGALVMRGFFFALIVTVFNCAAAFALLALCREIPFLYGFIHVAALSLALSSGSVIFVLSRLYRAMREKKPLEGGYCGAARTFHIYLSNLDDYGITRAGALFSVRSFAAYTLAPVFWYVIASLPGLLIWAGFAFLERRFGKDGYGGEFSRLPHFLDLCFGLIPRFLSALIFVIVSAFTPKAGVARALKSFGKNPGKQGFAAHVVASSLDITLGGPVTDLDGVKRNYGWIGPEGATARLEAGHLKRIIYMLCVAQFLVLCVLLVSVLAA